MTRKVLLDTITDAVISVDTQGIVREFHPSLLGLFEASPTAVGQPLKNVLNEHPAVLERLLTMTETHDELVIQDRTHKTHYFDLWMLPYEEDDQCAGKLFIFHDVTARRETNSTAQERDLLRTVIDIFPESIYVKNRDSQFLIANLKVVQGFGVNSADDLIGKTDFDFLPPEVSWQFFAEEQQIMQTGEPLLGRELPVTTASGQLIWVTYTKAPLRNAAGEIIGLVGISRNITAQKLAEQALAEERALLSDLIDAMPDYIFVKDTESRFLLANDACLRAFDLETFAELAGKTDFDFLPPALAQRYFDQEQAIIHGGTPIIHEEEQITHPSYGLQWFSSTKVPLRNSNGTIIGLACIVRVLTEQKLAEKALNEHHHLLRSLIDHLPDFVYVKDLEGRYILDNLAHARSVGATPAEMIGKQDFDLFPLEMAQGFFSDDMRVCETGEPLLNHEEVSLNVNQETVWVISNKIPFRDTEGKIIGMIGQTYDITERKIAEKQALELATERERVKMLSDFVRDVSHDFRTPLALINTSLYLLERSQDEAQRKVHLDKIEATSASIEKLFDRMTMMMKFDTSMALHRVPTNINNLVSHVAAKLGPSARLKNITIVRQLADSFPSVLIDVEVFNLALKELLENALTYTSSGGIVTMQTRVQNDKLVIGVADNGIGIADTELSYIFERLYRVDKARSAGEGHMGLGLSIAKRIVELHGGEITVQSLLGKGSLFEVRLSLAEATKSEHV
jgi:PAS domain S-box-containing protein